MRTMKEISYNDLIEMKKALRVIYKNQKRLELEQKQIRMMVEDEKLASDARFPSNGSYNRIHA
jgi:hypothetical protein